MINKDPFGGVSSELESKSPSPFKIDKEEALKQILKSQIKANKNLQKAIEEDFFSFRNELHMGQTIKGSYQIPSGLYGAAYQWSMPGCNEIKNEWPFLKIDFTDKGPVIDKICSENIKWTLSKLFVQGKENGETKTGAYWKQMVFHMFDELESKGFFSTPLPERVDKKITINRRKSSSKKGVDLSKAFWKNWNIPQENWVVDVKKGQKEPPPEPLRIELDANDDYDKYFLGNPKPTRSEV